jgi:nucleoid-associated protein YgaU
MPSQGYGGHPIGARPKRKALTVYQGRQPFMLTCPLLLHRAGESVESDRLALEQMAAREEDVAPPHITIAGKNLPIPVAVTDDWWIEDLQWGASPEEEHRREDDWALLRRNVTVVLLERVDDETIGSDPAGLRIVKQKPQASGRRYLVKAGDTWASISAREYGTPGRGKEIAEVNGLRPSNGALKAKVGKEINLP